MLELGSDPGDFSQAEFAAALAVLQRSVQSGQVAYVSNYYLQPLIKGRIAACVGWAGDALFASNPDIRFAWPATGGMIWTDSEVRTDERGRPYFAYSGTVLATAQRLGVERVHVSLSHDGGIASAVVIAEGA